RRRVWNWANDLVSVYPSGSTRLRTLLPLICRGLDESISNAVPSHGDFHPSNIFIARDRITGIDLDKFCLREPEADVAWFLMQSAAFGFFAEHTFKCTLKARRAFLEHYTAEARGPVRAERIALHMALAFLRNLHFELVLLKTGRTEYAD